MITLLFFAYLKEAIGKERLQLDASSMTVKELKQQLVSDYGFDLQHVMVAVNEEYATDDRVLQAGDIVAFIPPVSGG
ncbi:molybdopterin converting factor subunit 1 [Anoxybacteroides amylolyticum]|uniref:Molybdopterin synthase sulfur carrier subunit n=1 Tax=Anoxybacteroides amylolyticum TaxID=294699 RepID=A0A160F3Y6_9BACL|nr:molybdopterin converting factor subunit 1 [Anoxybacillus amylolyticus]ANB61097.1 molybdopterin converting factor, subunit 1 [Anoxybacillus amylolyticus]